MKFLHVCFRKDPQDFFAWPVTDVIAPGYSSIIAHPIDFSTINKKIDDRDYKSVPDFKVSICWKNYNY